MRACVVCCLFHAAVSYGSQFFWSLNHISELKPAYIALWAFFFNCFFSTCSNPCIKYKFQLHNSKTPEWALFILHIQTILLPFYGLWWLYCRVRCNGLPCSTNLQIGRVCSLNILLYEAVRKTEIHSGLFIWEVYKFTWKQSQAAVTSCSSSCLHFYILRL